MKLRILYILCLLVLLIAPAMAADTYMGYVTSRGMDTITVFDPNTNAVLTSFSTGAQPRGVCVNPSGTYIYVPALTENALEIYDASDNTKLYSISVTSPFRAVTNSLGDTVYVDSTYNSIYIIDAATHTVTGTISLAGGSAARGMLIVGNELYVACEGSNKVAYIDLTTNTVGGYINVGAQPWDLCAEPDGTHIYVSNLGVNTINKITTATHTVAATITVGTSPMGMTIDSAGTYLYVVNSASNNVSVITIASATVSASINVHSVPQNIDLEPNGQRLYVTNYNDNNISVISTATNTVTGSINLTYSSPDFIVIKKVAAEATNTAPMQVTFTVTSGVLIQTDANVSVYDATTGIFISSDNTDDAGNTIFWLIPGKRYTVNVTGINIISNSQSVQVQPSKDRYTINVDTTGFNWNPFDWFNTNGTGTNGSPDNIKAVTSGYTAKLDGTTGYIDVKYNDTTGQTSAVNFSLYYRNPATKTFDLVTSHVVASNDASYNFTILNADNKSYRFYANGTNPLFGTVSRMGMHSFPNVPLNLGWPAQYYGYFEMFVFLCIGYMSTRRKSVMLAGATFLLFISWVFLLIGWMAQLSLLTPILISVLAIFIFAYAVAKWRMESGI